MMRMPCLLVATLLSTVSSAGAQSCDYHEVDPGNGRIRLGWGKLDLGAGDAPRHPESWRGPIVLTQPGGGYCVTDLHASQIERPLYTDGQNLMLTTYSTVDGLRSVFILSAATCRVLWKSPAFSGHVVLTADTLRMGHTTWKLGPHCLPEGDVH
ncbi:hypothetical protein [Nitrospirillum iridis]|uniref:Uncharacterized protein n=1 Tax=Nitrospirillum iridis TaxID=765888 RepID=A0A7X0B3X0_9PROT|nr:hypothetical protein [Nitrospirillum iridis]MBB6255292.1 hypothetical protein [Nitrospirillum iridis]